MSEVDEMTRATATTARGSQTEANLEKLSESDRLLALQLLSASRELRRTAVRELRDTDLPRIMGLAGIELIEPAAREQARRWTAL